MKGQILVDKIKIKGQIAIYANVFWLNLFWPMPSVVYGNIDTWLINSCGILDKLKAFKNEKS